jgi:hypothetical protein
MSRKIFIPVLFLFLISCEKTSDNEILRFYGDAYENIGYSLAKSTNGYLIAGQYTRIKRAGDVITGSLKKMAIFETDLNGNQLRIDTVALQLPSCGNKVKSLSDGSAVVAGYAIDPVSQQDIFIVKFATGGEGRTEKVIKIGGNQTANDIIKTNEGFLVLGTTDAERGASGDQGNVKGKKDLFFLRLTENLDIIDSVKCGFTGNDEGLAMRAVGGGYVVVGTTDRYSATTGTDVFLLSVNADVSTTNFRFIQETGNQTAADFEIVSDGYLIAGNTVSSSGDSKGHAWKITGDILGTVSGHEITIGSEPFSISSLCTYKTNSFLMAGQYGPVSSGSLLIFATDMFGYPVEGRTKIAGGTGNQAVSDVLSDGEDIIAVGRNSYENNSMITLLKFRF